MLIFLLPVVDPAGGFIQIGDGGFSAGCLQFLIFIDSNSFSEDSRLAPAPHRQQNHWQSERLARDLDLVFNRHL
jgi:hypothetical protein